MTHQRRRLTWIFMAKSLAGDCRHPVVRRHGQLRLCRDCGLLLGYRVPYRALSVTTLAKALPDWRHNPNYRWITVHPGGGQESPGIPVLIKVHPDGTAHVVGGAGGSLNYKVLTQIKSPEEYALEARVRRQEARAKEAERKAAMTAQTRAARAEALEQIRQQQEQSRAEFIARISKLAGWTETPALPPEIAEQMPPESRERIERERARRLLHRAEDTVRGIEAQVVKACNEEAARGLGDVAVTDLDTRPIDSSGDGYVLNAERLAEENGFTPALAARVAVARRIEAFARAEEAGLIKSAEAAETLTEKLQAGAAQARAEDLPYRLQGLHQPKVPTEVNSPAAMREALLAYQEYKAATRELEKKQRGIVGAEYRDVGEVPAGVALVPERPPREELIKQVEDSLLNRAMMEAADEFLGEVYERVDSREELQRHVQSGRYTQLTEICETALGQEAPLNRHVADILGNEGTATLLAYYLARHLSAEQFAVVKQSLEQWHEQSQIERAREAREKAREQMELAEKAVAGLPPVGQCDAVELQTLAAAENERRKHLGEAQRILGAALGRLETLGELNSQLAGIENADDLPSRLTVSLGPTSTRHALALGQALGLKFQEDFDVVTDGPNKYLHIARAAFDKLLEEPDFEEAQLRQEVLAIRRGEQDEEGWLPAGIEARATAEYASRYQPAYQFSVEPDFAGLSGEPLRQALRRYVGLSLARDGAGSLDDIRLRVLSAEFLADHLAPGQRDEFQRYAAELLPADLTKRPRQAMELADGLVAEATAGDPQRQALDNQTVAITEATYEAMHRALAGFPVGRAAFTPLAQMTPADREALRSYFWEHLAKWGERPNAAETRRRREELERKLGEVVREETDLFGETHRITWGETPEGKAALAALEAREKEDGPWDFYCRMMGGVDHAYRALQEEVRGRLLESFARHYQELTGVELRSAQAPLHKATYHWIGTMDEAQYQRFSQGFDPKTREQLEALRGRKLAGQKGGGQYTSGSVKKLLANIEAGVRRYNLQIFADKANLPSRLTLGRTAENQLRRVWSQMADSFDPRRPVQVAKDVSMSGRYVHQQRAVKCVERAKRQAVNFSTGAGKTLVGIGSFTDLHHKGLVQRGIFVVPPAIQEQFGSEMLKYTTPGTHKFWANSRADAAERRRVYADPNVHMLAVSHQAFRDDLTWAVAQNRFGGDLRQAAHFLRDAPEADRNRAIQEAVKAQGWEFQFAMLDEAHDALNRKGKPNSRLANALDGFTAHVPYYLNSTATPVKNDISEAFELLHKMRPDKYPADRREEFLRRYGLDTREAREALQRLVAPYLYPSNVDTGVVRRQTDVHANLTDQQRQAYREIVRAYQTARKAEPGSEQWRQAMLRLCRPGELEGLSAEQRDRLLQQRARFLSAARDRALERVVHGAAEIGWQNTDSILRVLDYVRERRHADLDGGMKPGVIFTVHREAADLLADALRAHGYRVGQIDGRLSGHETDQRRLGFHPVVNGLSSDPVEATRQRRAAAKYDVLVATDAASMGLNLDRGQWVLHHELPWTAMTHIQRNGRIDRLSQTSPGVEVGDVITPTPVDRRKREVVGDKYDLTHTFSENSELLDDSGLALLLRRNLGRDLKRGAEALTAAAA